MNFKTARVLPYPVHAWTGCSKVVTAGRERDGCDAAGEGALLPDSRSCDTSRHGKREGCIIKRFWSNFVAASKSHTTFCAGKRTRRFVK